MDNQELITRVEPIIKDFLEERGFELVELTYRYENGRNVLRALVDLPTGGINLDQCAGLNRELGDILEQQQVMPEGYDLEVNSPGLDRPLLTERDFARNLGKQIKVFLTEPINGKIEVDGTATEVSAEEVTFLTSNGPVSLPLSKINKGKLII